MLRSLRSFMFLAKELNNLYVLLDLISCQKLKKERERTERSLKKWERPERSEQKERSAQP